MLPGSVRRVNEASAQLWDEAADSFDDEPDHGLRDARIEAAWRELLTSALPEAPARVADLGCGTGMLARLLVDNGFVVDGLDFSSVMLEHARRKVPQAQFLLGDASNPPLQRRAYDVVLSRHVLWALPDPAAAFVAWTALLKPGGTVVLIEGRWATGAGLAAEQAERIVRRARRKVDIRPLHEAVYWGKDITDERYILVSEA